MLKTSVFVLFGIVGSTSFGDSAKSSNINMKVYSCSAVGSSRIAYDQGVTETDDKGARGVHIRAPNATLAVVSAQAFFALPERGHFRDRARIVDMSTVEVECDEIRK